MKICPKCHRKNFDSAKFCRYCGNKFPKHQPSTSSVAPQHDSSTDNQSSLNSQQPPKPKYLVCPQCGTKNKPDAKFCFNCGYNFTGQQAQPQQSAPRPHRNYKKQWKQANQTMNRAGGFFSDYFVWFKNTLKTPFEQFRCGPYFGLVSFFLIGLFVWGANLIAMKNGKAGNIQLLIDGMPIPTGVDMDPAMKMAGYQSLSAFVMVFVDLALCIFATYFAERVITKKKIPLLRFINHFARLNNLSVVTGLLLVVASMIHIQLIMYIFICFIGLMIFLSVADCLKSASKGHETKISPLYIALTLVIVIMIIQPYLSQAIRAIL